MVVRHDRQLEKMRNPWRLVSGHVCEGASRLGKVKWEDLTLRQVAPLRGSTPETIPK